MSTLTHATNTVNPKPTLSVSVRHLIASHPLLTFFILAFAGTWLTLLPVVLGQDGSGVLHYTVPTAPFYLLMLFLGPTLAALVTTALVDGKAGVGQLLRRYLAWRVGIQWYLLVLLGPIILLVLGATVLFGTTPLRELAHQWPLFFTVYLANLPIILVLGGPLGEEPGWRGFALPRLQQQYGALTGSLILGVLHGLWHLPLFFITETGYGPFTFTGLLLFVLPMIFNTLIWTWVFNHTKGSLLIVILLHTAFNASGGFVQPLLPASPQMEWLPWLAYGGFALLLIVLTKGTLSYRRDSGDNQAQVPSQKKERVNNMKLLKTLGKITLAIVAGLVALFILFYILTIGDYAVAQDPSIPHITINGVTFHAETFGDPANPVVIAIHGGPGVDYRSMLSLQALSDQYFVVFYDQRGTGLSPRVNPARNHPGVRTHRSGFDR